MKALMKTFFLALVLSVLSQTQAEAQTAVNIAHWRKMEWLPSFPYFRFDDVYRLDSDTSRDLPPAGYGRIGVDFVLRNAASGDFVVPLYSCYRTLWIGRRLLLDHFVSTSSQCEGFSRDVFLGFGIPAERPVKDSVTLMRFFSPYAQSHLADVLSLFRRSSAIYPTFEVEGPIARVIRPAGQADTPFVSDEFVMVSSSRYAGAISELWWGGKQFINNFDHGRQLQMAWQGNGNGECYNPTEAGNLSDGSGYASTSRLEGVRHTGWQLDSSTLPAYWLRPGQPGGLFCPANSGGVAVNSSEVSKSSIGKTIVYGSIPSEPRAIKYITRLTLRESLSQLQIEAPTAYLNADMNQFYSWNPSTGNTSPLGLIYYQESPLPPIIATGNGQYAIGVFSPSGPQPSYGYGYFPISGGTVDNTAATSKWTVVFRTGALAPGEYTWTSYICVGSVGEVVACLNKVKNSGKSF